MVVNRWNLPNLPDTIRFVDGILRERNASASFFLTMMNDVGHRKAPEWAVPLEEMEPGLDRAVQLCQSLGRAIDPFVGDCAPPLCLLRDPGPVMPQEREVAGMSPRSDVAYLEAGSEVPENGRVKATACRGCRHDPYCRGIPASLAARFGWSALRPESP